MKSFVYNTLITFITRIFLVFFSFGISVIIARTLGPEGKGITSLVILIPSFLVLFTTLGTEITTVYFLSKKKYQLQQIINNSMFSVLFIGIPVGILLWFFAPQISSFFLKGLNPIYLRIVASLVPIMMFQIYNQEIIRGEQRFKHYNFINFFLYCFLFFAIILFVIFLKYGIIGILISNILAILGAGIISFIFIKQTHNCNFFPILHRKIFVESIKFGMKARLANVLQFFNYRFDLFIVNWFLGVENVGYYAIAVLVGGSLWFIPDSIATVLFPKTASSDLKEASLFTAKICRNTIFLTLISAGFLFIISDYLIPIAFGKAFIPSILLLKILLPGVVMLSFWKILASHLTGQGMPQYYSYSAGIALLFTLIFDFILIPNIGIIGAPIASTIAYSIAGFLTIFWFSIKTGINIKKIVFLTKDDFLIYKNIFYKVSNYRIFSK